MNIYFYCSGIITGENASFNFKLPVSYSKELFRDKPWCYSEYFDNFTQVCQISQRETMRT